MSRTGRSIQTENRPMVAGAWGRGEEWKCLLQGDDNVLDLDGGGGCTQCDVLNATDLYTLK